MKTPTREQVPLDATWDLQDLFAHDSAWEAAFAAVEEGRAVLAREKDRMAEGAATLLAILEAEERLQIQLIRVGTFARLRLAQDGTNGASQAAVARVAALQARVEADTSFIDAEILALPEATLEQFMKDAPGLAEFRVRLDELAAKRPHRLSAQTESVLAALGEVLDSPYMVYGRAKFGDMRFEPFTDEAGALTANSINAFESNFESHASVTVRRNAWASFTAGLKRHHHSFAATFAAETSKNVALARLRGYASAEDFLLHDHKVPRSLYDNILNIIQTELAPHMRRYARLRQRVLGLDKLLYCDIKAPLDPEFNPPMPYEASCELILQSLTVMGSEYVAFARRAMTQRWVDRADNLGKNSGAFCASPYGVHPYILITWSDTMRNVFTLAHELGHGGHFGLAMQHQRLTNTRPGMPFIEAPSIMNEMLLADHILAGSQEPRLRRSVIMQVLGTFHHNFITHLLEAELQRRVYARAESGGSITAAVLDGLKGDVLSSFWGDTVEIDDGARMTWMRQPHYYLGLYPYTYSVGLVASVAMARRIQEEGAPAVARWLEVLKAGGTRTPLELMAHAGIDMASPQPIHEAVAYAGRLIDELEALF